MITAGRVKIDGSFMIKLMNKRNKKNRLDKLLIVEDPVFDENWNSSKVMPLQMKYCDKARQLVEYVEKEIGFKDGLVRGAKNSDRMSISINSYLAIAYHGLGRTGDSEHFIEMINKMSQQDMDVDITDILAFAIAERILGFSTKDPQHPLGVIRKSFGFHEVAFNNQKYEFVVEKKDAPVVSSHKNSLLSIYYSIIGEKEKARKVMNGIFECIGYEDFKGNQLTERPGSNDKIAVRDRMRDEQGILHYNSYNNAVCAIANKCIDEELFASALLFANDSRELRRDGKKLYYEREGRSHASTNLLMAIAEMMYYD